MPTQKQFLDHTGLTELLDELGQYLKSKLNKLTVGDGVAIDNNDTIRTTGIPFGRCDSTSTATVFTATVPGIYKLEDGVCCMIDNGVVTSASGFTLNVNGLGAKPVYTNLAAATRDTTIFNINYTMLFVYDETRVSGGCWVCYRGYDSNTNTIGYQLRTDSTVRNVSDTARYYKIYFTSADGTKWVPASVNSTNNATSARPVNQRPIDPFGRIVYTSDNTNYAAGANLAATTIWDQYNLTLGYSFNRTGAALTLTAEASVYLKCAPLTDGSAIMDADTPIVLTLPTTNDGKIYIFLGVAISATAIELVPHHPVYYHDGTGIRIWTGKDSYSKSEVEDNELVIARSLTELHDTKQELLTFDNTPTANSGNPVTSEGIKKALDDKQDKMVVMFRQVEGDTLSCDKSIADIYTAVSAGTEVVGLASDSTLLAVARVSVADSDFCVFDMQYGGLYTNLIGSVVNGTDVWQREQYLRLISDDLVTRWNSKQDALVSGTNIKTVCGSSILGSGDLQLVADDIYTGYGSVEDALNAKQDTLVSGTNIKTVNNNSLLGSGNVDLGGGDILYLGKGKYVLENAVDSSIDNALDDLDNAIHELGTPNEIARITATESQTSGGNNVVTITETNGTTTTFNVKNGIDGQDGQDGADGVSLGEVALVQTTGDSEESVMSQRSVTDELLLDYSTNFRSLVWEGGLISSNNGANGTNGNYYRTRDYIEISNTTTGVVLNIDGTFDIMFYNSSGGYLGYRTITNNSVEITRATYPTLGRIRACCYKTYYTIKNLANTTVKASNYELLKSAIKQTTGQSEGSLMSQKAITDSIYRNIKVQNCSCGYLKPNTNHVINLTDAQYSRLNATDVASFRFILTEPENYVSVSMTLRYVGINGNNTNRSADNAFEFGWDYSKRMFARGKNYNTATCINKTSSGTIINPLVFTLVWDRINGIIKYYERDTLISTQTYDEYKLDYFIAPSKSICFYGGDTGFYLYDVQIFDYDISKLFFATYENTLYGASMVFTKYANNFGNSTDNWVELNGSYSTYGASISGTIESTFPGDGTRVLTSTSNCTTSTYYTCGYYVGNSVQLQRWECDIEVVSGECAIWEGSANSSFITSIVDSNDNVYSRGDTLGVGSYTVKGVSGGTGVWYLYYRSGSMQVIYKKQRHKLISCVVHLKCDTFYDGFLYDDQAKHFYDQSNGLVPDNTPFTLPRTTTNNPPNYAGQMAVPSNGNIYIGTKNYVWKQINNS